MIRALPQAGDGQPLGVPGTTAPDTIPVTAAEPTEEAVAQLERDWPDWQVWVVRRVIGGPVWCARRRDDHKRVLNADTAEHLAEYLEAECSR